MNIEHFLNLLNYESAIEIISTDVKNNIYHFNSNDKHYSLAKVDNIWELMNWELLDVIKCYKSNFDVIYNLYNDI